VPSLTPVSPIIHPYRFETRSLAPAKMIMLKMTRDRHFLFGIITSMTIKRLAKIPIKNTLIALVIFIAIFLTLRIPQLMLARTYDAECNGVVTCMNTQGRSPINIVLADLIFVSRICIELGLIFLVVQLASKAVLRK
jgi:hypothetical protein